MFCTPKIQRARIKEKKGTKLIKFCHSSKARIIVSWLLHTEKFIFEVILVNFCSRQSESPDDQNLRGFTVPKSKIWGTCLRISLNTKTKRRRKVRAPPASHRAWRPITSNTSVLSEQNYLQANRLWIATPWKQAGSRTAIQRIKLTNHSQKACKWKENQRKPTHDTKQRHATKRFSQYSH